MPGSWLNVPHFRQEFNYSCVPACVRMVLAYFGMRHTEQELRDLLETDTHGTKVRNLLALRSLGIDVQLAPSNLNSLREVITSGTAPIIFIETGSLPYWTVDCEHTAVFVSGDEAIAYLNDPYFNIAPQSVSLDCFEKAWSPTGRFSAILRPRSPS